jgi:hypothetical protein
MEPLAPLMATMMRKTAPLQKLCSEFRTEMLDVSCPAAFAPL